MGGGCAARLLRTCHRGAHRCRETTRIATELSWGSDHAARAPLVPCFARCRRDARSLRAQVPASARLRSKGRSHDVRQLLLSGAPLLRPPDNRKAACAEVLRIARQLKPGVLATSGYGLSSCGGGSRGPVSPTLSHMETACSPQLMLSLCALRVLGCSAPACRAASHALALDCTKMARVCVTGLRENE